VWISCCFFKAANFCSCASLTSDGKFCNFKNGIRVRVRVSCVRKEGMLPFWACVRRTESDFWEKREVWISWWWIDGLGDYWPSRAACLNRREPCLMFSVLCLVRFSSFRFASLLLSDVWTQRSLTEGFFSD
jgi:hypothetical protein